MTGYHRQLEQFTGNHFRPREPLALRRHLFFHGIPWLLLLAEFRSLLA
jgi:hypothetical protein